MNAVKHFFKKNGIRIAFTVVFILASSAVAWTARFVIFYSAVSNNTSGEAQRQVMTLDNELFDVVTDAKNMKVESRVALPADIRDPFSEPYIPPPPEETVETDDEELGTEDESPTPPPDDKVPPSEE